MRGREDKTPEETPKDEPKGMEKPAPEHGRPQTSRPAEPTATRPAPAPTGPVHPPEPVKPAPETAQPPESKDVPPEEKGPKAPEKGQAPLMEMDLQSLLGYLLLYQSRAGEGHPPVTVYAHGEDGLVVVPHRLVKFMQTTSLG